MSDLSLPQLNEQLRVYIQEKREVERLRERQRQLAEEIRHNETLLYDLEIQLEKESRNLQSMAQKGFRHFAATLLGQKEQWMDEDAQRYFSRRQERDQRYTLISEARSEMAQLDRQLSHLGSVEAHYAELISLKERLLLDAQVGPYVIVLVTLENWRQDQREVQGIVAFTAKLKKLLELMIRRVGRAQIAEQQGQLAVHREILKVLEDWKTLYRGLLHLERKLKLLLAEVPLELPRSPSFYPKLFGHFVDTQVEVPEPRRWKRMVPGAMTAYWHLRGEKAFYSLQTYAQELKACLHALRESEAVLTRKMEVGEQERQHLLESL